MIAILAVACGAAREPAPLATLTPARVTPGDAPRERVIVTTTEIDILDPITFLAGSATLHPRSTRTLDAIASTLSGNPSIKLVQVRAYGTDALAQFQARVGAERARAIVDALVARGVGRGRLIATGRATPPSGVTSGPSLEILLRDP